MFLRPLLISLSLLVATARLSSSSSEDHDTTVTVVKVPTATLHNGVVLPLVGLGCASGVREHHVSSALSAGYRFFDTAQSYNWGYHEDEVGAAIQKFRNKNGAEDPIVVQTKIHPEDLGYEATKRAVQKSLGRLKVHTLDSVLIHKPHCWEGACTKVPEGTWQESWKALEEFYEAGTITKSIGICDVSSIGLLEELLSQKIKPHVIQNWMDPFHQDTLMRKRIQDHGILYQAYSSLGTQWHHHKGHTKNPVTNHPTLLQIAEAHGPDVDVGQVVVHWATTRHGIAVLPASTNPVRQEGNLHHSFRFVLTEDELDSIDALDGRVPPNNNADEANDEVSILFQKDKDDTGGDGGGGGDGTASSIDVYWINHGENGEEVHVGSVSTGNDLSLNSHHGHTFRFRDPSGSNNAYRDHTIEKEIGNRQVHVIAQNENGDVNEDEEEL
jgi:diketogulonate reductase-like aldo/keto reductase